MAKLLEAYDMMTVQENQYIEILKNIVEIHEMAVDDVAKEIEEKKKAVPVPEKVAPETEKKSENEEKEPETAKEGEEKANDGGLKEIRGKMKVQTKETSQSWRRRCGNCRRCRQQPRRLLSYTSNSWRNFNYRRARWGKGVSGAGPAMHGVFMAPLRVPPPSMLFILYVWLL